MAAAPLSLSEIYALLADNTAGDISAEDMRNITGSLYGYSNVLDPDAYRSAFTNFTESTITGGGFSTNNSGTGSSVSAIAAHDTTDFGVARLNTGSTTTGVAGVRTGSQILAFGAREHRFYTKIYIPTLSDGTDTYSAWFGFGNNSTGPTQINGAMFLYDTAGVATGAAASANWQLCTAQTNTRTYTTTGTAVAATTHIRLEIRVNAAGTSVGFYINGTLVGTHTTNIPTANIGCHMTILKSAGTTGRQIESDLIGVRQFPPVT